MGVLLAGSILLSYMLGNFGGISLDALKKDYVQKDELKFSDLPKELQKNYINKQDIKNSTGSVIEDERAFDEDGNPIEIIEGSNDDLQSIIGSLQSKILFLEKENMLISNEKDELLKQINNIKSEIQNEQHTLLSSNLEKINEVERQHYQNISELTMKINNLQRENIRLTQAINKHKEEKENQAKIIQDKVAQAKEDIKQEYEKKIKSQESKIALLNDQKKTLRERVDTIQDKAKKSDTAQSNKLKQKDLQITSLQKKVNELIAEKNDILTKNSDNILELEKKNSQKTKEFNDIIMSHKAEKDALKQSYNESIEKTKMSYETRLQSLQNDVESLSDKLLKAQEEKSQTIAKKQESFEKQKEELLAKQKSSLTTVQNKNKTLQKALDNSLAKNKDLQKELEKIEASLQTSNDKQLQLQDQIAALENQKNSTSQKLEEMLNEKEEKHNQNYKIFNEKIATLENQLEQIQSKSQEYISNLQIKTQAQQNSIKTKLDETLAKLKEEKTQKEKLNKSLKDSQETIAQLKKSNKTLTMSENEKLIEIRDSFEKLQANVQKREKAYEEAIDELKNDLEARNKTLANYENDKEKMQRYTQEIAQLKETLDTMEDQVASSDTAPISDKKRKLAQIDKVECDDMNFGNFQISSACEQKVNSFLDKYDESHYFEVIPIVDTGGFSTLKRIKTESNLDVPQSEIDRLTNLANLGLGKHRAKEAGWLIREKYGDFAKISYTVYNIEAEDKRGFVIRAYR